MATASDMAAANFWRFSLDRYARPGVAPLLLALQDDYGADVNILLYCLYQGSECGCLLSSEELARLEQVVEPWNAAVVRPLRGLRQTMRILEADPDAAAIRGEIKRLELRAEEGAQARIVAAGITGTPAPNAAWLNLDRYRGGAASALVQALVEAAI